MIKYYSITTIVILVLLGGYGFSNIENTSLDETPVTNILTNLGEDFSDKRPDFTNKKVSAKAGEQLFNQGFSIVDGSEAKRQSKHFVCTSCHNTVKEDPDVSVNDPQARLEYTASIGVPFLQGTTMYGAVNRETYYNGDYYLKYGDLVDPARNDIREAIQLCATQCAQGRPLRDWEIESMLAYLWTLEYKVSDLDLSDDLKNRIANANSKSDDKEEIVADIKSNYLLASEATFIKPPEDRKKGTGLTGDPENGKLIYDNSCLHCHYQGRYAYFHLDNSKLTLKHLKRKIPTYSSHSIYQVVRWGIGSHYWNESYMPQYTEEKMSDQQLADLVAYINQ